MQTLRTGCSKVDPQTNTQLGDYNTLRNLARSVIIIEFQARNTVITSEVLAIGRIIVQ